MHLLAIAVSLGPKLSSKPERECLLSTHCGHSEEHEHARRIVPPSMQNPALGIAESGVLTGGAF